MIFDIPSEDAVNYVEVKRVVEWRGTVVYRVIATGKHVIREHAKNLPADYIAEEIPVVKNRMRIDVVYPSYFEGK